MTTVELDAIEARANAATEGPWDFLCKLMDPPWPSQIVRDTPNLAPVVVFDWQACMPQHDDVRFMCAARTDVPALVAEVRALKALLKEMPWPFDEFNRSHSCPICKAARPWTTPMVHAPGCALAAALK